MQIPEPPYYCRLCDSAVSSDEVEPTAHGDEVHRACGAVLADRTAGVDGCTLDTMLLAAGFVDLYGNGSSGPVPLDSGRSALRSHRRTPPIRARPTKLCKAQYAVSAPSSMGYHRIYHFHERISQRQNIEVRAQRV